MLKELRIWIVQARHVLFDGSAMACGGGGVVTCLL